MPSRVSGVPGLGRKQVALRARPDLDITSLIQGGRPVYVVKDPIALKYFRFKVEDAGSALALRTGMSANVSIDTGKSRGLGVFAGLFGTANAAE